MPMPPLQSLSKKKNAYAVQAAAPAFVFVAVCHTVYTLFTVVVLVDTAAGSVVEEVTALPVWVLKTAVVEAGSVVVRVVTRMALFTTVEVTTGRVV
jgi:hypothetical protein